MRALDTLFPWWDSTWMMDLNDLRVFEKVASLRSFSAAARALGLPKSSVSRGVARLETELGARLLQRTTRDVVLTEAGMVLRARCADILARIGEAVELVDGFVSAPRGLLRISAGVGFGVHVLSLVLPRFLERYPRIEVSLRLGNRSLDLVSDGMDIAIQMGPLADSQFISSRLGTMERYLCAAPTYLQRRGTPRTIEELRDHDRIETPGNGGLPRSWVFFNETGRTVRFEENPRLSTNDTVTIHGLIVNGGGIGVLSGFICVPDFREGRLVRLLPEWNMPGLEVSIVFPSSRELSQTVRAFIDFLKNSPDMGKLWSNGTHQPSSIDGPSAIKANQPAPKKTDRSAARNRPISSAGRSGKSGV
jgi:LysR family transcriptional regulator, regulator for bpeEF and oprC